MGSVILPLERDAILACIEKKRYTVSVPDIRIRRSSCLASTGLDVGIFPGKPGLKQFSNLDTREAKSSKGFATENIATFRDIHIECLAVEPSLTP